VKSPAHVNTRLVLDIPTEDAGDVEDLDEDNDDDVKSSVSIPGDGMTCGHSWGGHSGRTLFNLIRGMHI